VPEEHIPDLSSGESIDIFLGCYTLSDRISIDIRGERSLDDEPMNALISRNPRDLILELTLSDRGLISIEAKVHTDLTSTFLLHSDIGETRRILSDEYDGEHRSITSRREGDLIFDRFEDGGGDETSVEEHGVVDRNKQKGARGDRR
jgi:hypothetical protein